MSKNSRSSPLVVPATLAEQMALLRSKTYVQRDHDPFLGMLRVGGAVPYTTLGDPFANAAEHLLAAKKFADNRIEHGQLPECSLTGYSNGRYFDDVRLLRGAEEAAGDLAATLKGSYPGIFIFGLPMVIQGALYNAGMALHVPTGKFLGASIKRFPPNNQQFNEHKVFAYGSTLTEKFVRFAGQRVPVGTNLVFRCRNIKNYTFGIPVCEDDWTISASSFWMAAWGATILSSLNGTDELIAKEDFRIQMLKDISQRCIAALTYNSVGPGESTYTQAYAGCQYIMENGHMLAEVKPLSWIDTYADPEIRGRSLVFRDVDLDHIEHDRLTTNSYQAAAAEMRGVRKFRVIEFDLDRGDAPRAFARTIAAHPYVPKSKEDLRKVCEKICRIKLAGDLHRFMYSETRQNLWVAYSGGADSTSRLCDAVKVMQALKRPASNVMALTMPGFGTSKGSYERVQKLVRGLGVTLREVDIKPVAFSIMKAMGHKPFGHDIANETPEQFIHWLRGFVAECAVKKEEPQDLIFENVQAHVRTLICTRYGFTFGTSNLSEAANAWCTYLADHLGGHYNSQQDQPKELVRAQLWFDGTFTFSGEASEALLATHAAIVSAELLPLGPNGELVQKTDATNGPEEVRDFFLRYLRRYQDSPDKIFIMAQHVNNYELWSQRYTDEQLFAWYQRFSFRFASMRFKPATHLDGVIKGSDSLARENWIVPSDPSKDFLQLPEDFDMGNYWAAIDAQVGEAPVAQSAL